MKRLFLVAQILVLTLALNVRLSHADGNSDDSASSIPQFQPIGPAPVAGGTSTFTSLEVECSDLVQFKPKSADSICSQQCSGTAFCKTLKSSATPQQEAILGQDARPTADNLGTGTPEAKSSTPTPSTAKAKAATTPKSAATSPGGSKTPASTTAAQPSSGDSSTDQQTCQKLQQAAVSCCTNPTPANCGYTDNGGNDASGYTAPPAGSAGLADYCKQMNSAGGTNGTANSTASGMCTRRYLACQNTCNSFAQTYSNQSDVAGIFSGKAQSCASLASIASQLSAQTQNSYTSANGGDACNQMASAMPQSGAGSTPQTAAGVNPNDPYGCQANPTNVACQSCTNNPSAPACQAMAAAAVNGDQPTAGFQNAPIAAKDSAFNVGSSDGIVPQTQFGNYTPQALQTTPIAQNPGDAIPGSDGSTSQATLGGGAGSRGSSPGSPGYNLDIDQGLRSGGYSQPVGGSSDGAAPGFVGNYTPKAAGSRGMPGLGMDLKQYLPGHSRDPAGRPGALNIQSAEIGGKFSDLWRKISIRYQEKCRLGELLDCR